MLRPRRPAERFDPHLLPPRSERAFTRTKMDGQCAVRLHRTGEVQAQKHTGAKGEALAIVLVKVAMTVFASVDTQGKRADRSLVGTLSKRSDRQDCALANIDGKVSQLRSDQKRLIRLLRVALLQITGGSLRAAIESLSGPIVVPDPRRQIHLVLPNLLRRWRWRNQQVRAKEELVTGVEIDGMVVGCGMRELKKEKKCEYEMELFLEEYDRERAEL